MANGLRVPVGLCITLMCAALRYSLGMTASMIDGRAQAQAVEEAVRSCLASWPAGVAPRLQVVLVGDNPASLVYIAGKERACNRVGISSDLLRLPTTTSTKELLAHLDRLADDVTIDAILVQMPLPAGIDVAAVVSALPPEKDVDGFSPYNIGRLAARWPEVIPCTPRGCMRLIRSTGMQIDGARAVVVGRGWVGNPMSMLLTRANATVTVCHRFTRNMADITAQASILVSAVGIPGLIRAEHIAPGAVVIDVGQKRVEGHLYGDVDRQAGEELAGWLTPVPGGVGPMTIAMLMDNTARLAARRRGLPAPR